MLWPLSDLSRFRAARPSRSYHASCPHFILLNEVSTRNRGFFPPMTTDWQFLSLPHASTPSREKDPLHMSSSFHALSSCLTFDFPHHKIDRSRARSVSRSFTYSRSTPTFAAGLVLQRSLKLPAPLLWALCSGINFFLPGIPVHFIIPFPANVFHGCFVSCGLKICGPSAGLYLLIVFS